MKERISIPLFTGSVADATDAFTPVLSSIVVVTVTEVKMFPYWSVIVPGEKENDSEF